MTLINEDNDDEDSDGEDDDSGGNKEKIKENSEMEMIVNYLLKYSDEILMVIVTTVARKTST